MAADDGTQQRAESLENALDLRSNPVLPKGQCVYIQSGDPGDFDGASRLHAAAAHVRSSVSCMCYCSWLPYTRVFDWSGWC